MIKSLNTDKFTCKCENCNSENINIFISHIYKGAYFYGAKLILKCKDCKNEFSGTY